MSAITDAYFLAGGISPVSRDGKPSGVKRYGTARVGVVEEIGDGLEDHAIFAGTMDVGGTFPIPLGSVSGGDVMVKGTGVDEEPVVEVVVAGDVRVERGGLKEGKVFLPFPALLGEEGAGWVGE